MPTELGPAYAPNFLGRPPAMPAGDLALWWRTRDRLTRGALRLYFNVRLGNGSAYHGIPDPDLERMWRQNTQARADLIIQRPNAVEIVELHAGSTAAEIGRLQAYAALWTLDPALPGLVALTLVSDTANEAALTLTQHLGISYIIAPPQMLA